MDNSKPASLALQAASLATRYHDVFRDVEIGVAPGELCVILGTRGAGKSALLRAIAGLETLTTGNLAIDGADITRSAPGERNIAYLDQAFPLWPDLSVLDNVRFAIHHRHTRREARKRAAEELGLVGLDDFARHMPSQLNPAQVQRVALARTLAATDNLCLLDEPFAAQSPPLRLQLARLLRRRQQLEGITMLVATEDAELALRIADRVVVMHDGCVLQSDAPQAIYEQPATVEVARLSGPVNLIEGDVKLNAGQAIFCSDKGLAVPLFDDAVKRPRTAQACFRPDALRIIDNHALPDSDDLRLSAKVLETEYLGAFTRYRIDVQGHVLWMDVTRRGHALGHVLGDTLAIGLDPEQIRVLEK